MNNKQKQQTKEIGFLGLSNDLKILIILAFCLGLVAYLAALYLTHSNVEMKKEIDSLPHKVCHNETSWTIDDKTFNITNGKTFVNDATYPSHLWIKNGSVSFPTGNVLYNKEVCEIR